MKVKKGLGLVLAAILMLGAVGCGNQTPANSLKEEGEGSQKASVEFFQFKREAVDTFNVLIEQFNKKYPDIEIKQNTVPDDTKVLQARAATNDFPDIYQRWPSDAAYRNYVKNGFIMDVTNEAFIENAIPAIRKSFEFDGKIYGVPLSMNASGVIYNKKIFEDAGVDIPTTWDAFIEVCETLKGKGITPIELMLKDAWTIKTFQQELMGNLVTAEEFQKVIGGEAKLADSEGWKQLCEKTLKILEYGQPDAAGAGYDQGIQEFANGKAAMMLQGIWAIPSIQKANAEIELGKFVLPAINNPDEVKLVSGIDVGLSIGAKTKSPDACKKFVAFLTSKESAQQYADMDKSISAIQGVKTNDAVLESLTPYFEKGKIFTWPEHFWPAGAGDEYGQLAQEFSAKKDIDEFTRRVDAMFEDIQK
ncbi:MAG: extracellular solute-binding protein [Firmicutes bacterium]|nr:extracellular solute-binding protein [Bacillota bacterium]